MSIIAPLPRSVRDLLDHNTHPGLMLDKYVVSYDPNATPGKLSERVQHPAVEAVARLSQSPPSGLPFDALRQRWSAMLSSLRAVTLSAVTRGPFTLHLARASALENAGICLHPIYGFVYQPGSGVKGMAHSFACEAWLPTQPDRAKAWQTICEVFGWAPSPWLTDLASRLGVSVPKESQAGAIVFHDAWPETWPRLTVDLLNNHHVGYYQKGEPPGDWDGPVPVYFLSVPPGQAFQFAVSPRRDDCPKPSVELAATWVAGALEYAGAGAKTASGYGDFEVRGITLPPAPPRVERAAVTLELVTPGFFAGSAQAEADCALRPASLRGMLRWWWRTLHVGFVDTKTLARLEAAVWGDVQLSGALRVTVVPLDAARPARFDKFHAQQDQRLPQPPNKKTTQGLWYHSFGMDDTKTVAGQSVRTQRWFMPPKARWRIVLQARSGRFALGTDGKGERVIPAAEVLEQGRLALWLLCHFGGLGAKCRKGFGSFVDPAELQAIDLAACKTQAAMFRASCGLGKGAFDSRLANSPTLEQALWWELELPGWNNPWVAVDQVGFSAQAFAQAHKHQKEKQALGLPRKIGHPPTGSFRAGRHVSDRHASPAWYHFGRTPTGMVLRVTAFPASELPTLKDSQAFLEKLLDHLKADLPGRIAASTGIGRANPASPRSTPKQQPQPAVQVQTNDTVEAELLAEKTNKGGWKARHLASGLVGNIVNSGDVPSDRKPGDKVQLVVASVSGLQGSFRWPTTPPPRQEKPPKKGKK